MKTDTKKLTTLAMLCAVAYIAMVVGRLPMSSVDFLRYDPKDIVITIGGFIYGPAAATVMTLVVSAIEMVTVSTTGIIGFVMNVVQTCAFACTAAFIYKKQHTQSGAVIGLAAGCLIATAAMLLWNYALTPIYSGMPREAVAAMLLPVFLPFNLLKGSINGALTVLLYKHIVKALRAAKLVPPSESGKEHKSSIIILIASAVVLALCIVAVLFIRGIL